MGSVFKKRINWDFFKQWTHEMSYVLGYIVADGCIAVRKDRMKNPYTLNITSADKEHLYKIRKVLDSEHAISKKFNGSSTGIIYQLQISNPVIADDLIELGIKPRKTYNLKPIEVPDDFFPDFVRGFFDGDGTVYIYQVNNVPQIKAGLVGANKLLINDFNNKICKRLEIPLKSVQQQTDVKRGRVTQHRITFYIDDCERLRQFMYGHNPSIYLDRKFEIFERWENIKRRKYVKHNYPSKVGWKLNEAFYAS